MPTNVSDLQLQRMKIIFEKIPKSNGVIFIKIQLKNLFIICLKNKRKSERIKIEAIISKYLDEVDYEFDVINMELREYFYKNYLIKLIRHYDLTFHFVPVFGKKAY